MTEPTDGKIYLDGEDITGYSERKLRKYRQKMQIVFQDPYSSLDPRETIGKSLEEVLAKLKELGLSLSTGESEE